MATTFLNVQQRIALDLLNRVDLTPEIKRAVQATIRKYENTRYPFNETATAINATIGQGYIAVPADFLILDQVEVQVNGTAFKLAPLDYEHFRRQAATSSTGQPIFQCQFANRLLVSPIPNSAWPVLVTYIQKLPVLVADTDTNKWLSAAEDVVVYGAAQLVSAQLGDVNSASKFGELEDYFCRKRLYPYRDQALFSYIKPTRF